LQSNFVLLLLRCKYC